MTCHGRMTKSRSMLWESPLLAVAQHGGCLAHSSRSRRGPTGRRGSVAVATEAHVDRRVDFFSPTLRSCAQRAERRMWGHGHHQQFYVEDVGFRPTRFAPRWAIKTLEPLRHRSGSSVSKKNFCSFSLKCLKLLLSFPTEHDVDEQVHIVDVDIAVAGHIGCIVLLILAK